MFQFRSYRTPVTASFAALLVVCACQRVNPGATSLEYPFAERSSHTDVYFGETVADPYRWMEDLESDQVASWVEAENAIAAPSGENRANQSVAAWKVNRLRTSRPRS